MFSPRGCLWFSSSGSAYKGLLHTRGIHHHLWKGWMKEEIVDQPGSRRRWGHADLEKIPYASFKKDLPPMRISLRDGWLSKLQPVMPSSKYQVFHNFYFAFYKILCWRPTKMLNISQHLIILYLSTFSIILPRVNFPSRQQDT